jgi:ankyrin repeat protein
VIPLFFPRQTLHKLTLSLALCFYMAVAWAGPLHDAVEAGDLHKVRKLVETQAADISEIDSRGIWPLLAAATDGNVDMVELLLELHADPNQQDQYHYSALHEAASLGFRDVIETLIQAGAEINARDINGITPLGYALRSSSVEAANLLQDFGATQ